MQAAEVKKLLEVTPFEPFALIMSNGRKFTIDHPEIALFSINRGSLAVALRSGGFAILDLRHATHSEPETTPTRRKKR